MNVKFDLPISVIRISKIEESFPYVSKSFWITDIGKSKWFTDIGNYFPISEIRFTDIGN